MRYKDANDTLMAGAERECMRLALEQAVEFAPKQVVHASEFREEFFKEWFSAELEPGLEMPFEFPFKFRPGELTIWTGIEKSGKTTFIGNVQVCLMAQGERVMVASFETKPAKTLKKYSRQVYGGILYNDPDRLQQIGKDKDLLEDYRREAMAKADETFAWLSENLWMYDFTGIGKWRTLSDDIRWAARRYGITQFVIDNFMRIGILKDDYAQQSEAIAHFAGLAMDLGVHIHMVVHQNKTADGGKRSVAGAFEIIANAHNILEVQRDVEKGAKIGELFDKLKVGAISQEKFSEAKADLDRKPDARLILHAAREGERQNAGRYLWFLWKAQQYVTDPPGHKNYSPICWLQTPKQKYQDFPDEEPKPEPTEVTTI
jgi:hypothetical protein